MKLQILEGETEPFIGNDKRLVAKERISENLSPRIIKAGKDLQDHRVQPLIDYHLVNLNTALRVMPSHFLST